MTGLKGKLCGKDRLTLAADPNPVEDLSYWRTSTGLEMDFIVGSLETAIEAKATSKSHPGPAGP